MLQIVHDVAPDAALAFYTADTSEADFAAGIGKLASAGRQGRSSMTRGYFDEPFFQDGIVAQAIDTVESQGVAYFSAAGNDGVAGYDNTAPVSDAIDHFAQCRRIPAQLRHHRAQPPPPRCR